MKPRCYSRFSILAASCSALYAASTCVHALDYNFGPVTEDFTLTASDQARAIGWNPGSFNNSGGDMGIYWRGGASDVTYMHFDLSALAGATINGGVSLNLTVDATYGGQITDGQISTANSAWTYSFGGGTPGLTAIGDSALLNGSFNTSDTAAWTISNATFQSYVNSPGTFYGLAVSGANGSTAHFAGTPTLTGNVSYSLVSVTGATDWTASSWNAGTSTLSIPGTSDVSGGNVLIRSGATVAVTDSGTMDLGTFSGSFQNFGTLSFASSAAQTLGGSISGTGVLEKSGSGTLSLTANNTISGGVTIDGGTLSVANNTLGTGAVTINNGGTLLASEGWVFGGNSPYGTNGNTIPSVTVNAGGVLQLNNGNGHLAGITNLYLNGGTVTGGGGYFEGSFGALFLANGNEQITAGNATTSTISVTSIGLTGNNNTITVDADSTLNISSVLKNSYWFGGETGGFIKSGDGTLNLSGISSYTGNTAVNGGSLVLADNAQLKFVVTDTNQNSVTGTATATFNGDFLIDTSAVTGTTGHIWLLVDKANLDPASSFTSTFTVIGFTDPEDDGVWTMTDVKGAWSFDESTGELTLDIGNDYDDWVTSNGVIGGENDDDDNDGVSNFEEYAFGLLPNSGSSVNPITVQLNKTTGQFTYQRRDNGLTNLAYTIWYSTDLVTWTEDTGATQPDGTPDGNGVETISVTLTPALLTNSKLFVQVRAN